MERCSARALALAVSTALLLAACDRKNEPDSEPPGGVVTSQPEPGSGGDPPMTAEPELAPGLTARGLVLGSTADPVAAVDGAEVSMRMLTRHGNEWLVATDGAQLRSGDAFKIEVELRTPQYVALLYQASDGSTVVLYPLEDEPAHLRAGRHQLPPAGSPLGDQLSLDDETGEELLLLISSARPLPEADAALDAIVQRTREPDAPALASAGSKAAASTSSSGGPKRGAALSPEQRQRRRASIDDRISKELRSRGNVLSRTDGATIDAKPGEDGIAVLTLSFEHVARSP